MRVIYLTNENSTCKFGTRPSQHGKYQDVEEFVIVSPNFFYHTSWTQAIPGGFEGNFDDLELAEDGPGPERERIESLRTEFFKTFVQVELRVEEKLLQTLKEKGVEHVITRPITCYVLNIWGSGRLSMSDLFKDPKQVLNSLNP